MRYDKLWVTFAHQMQERQFGEVAKILQGKKREGTRHEGALSAEEFRQILDLMDGEGTITTKQVRREIDRNPSTIKRAIYAANVLRRLDSASLTSASPEALAKEAPYEITPHYMSNKLNDFKAWLKNKDTLDSGDDVGKPFSMVQLHRVEQILSCMWVPHPDHVPLKLTQVDDGLYQENAYGKIFKWEQTDGTVSLCWVDRSMQSWLLDRVFCNLEDDSREDIGARWRELQRLMCEFLEDAKTNNFYIDPGMGGCTVMDVENMVFPEFERVFSPEYAETFSRARRLSEEYPRIREKVTQFKDLLLNSIFSQA